MTAPRSDAPYPDDRPPGDGGELPGSSEILPPPWHVVEAAVATALAEDLGLAGDVTTAALVDPEAIGRGLLVFRRAGVLAGTWTTEAVCGRFDLMVSWDALDGDVLEAGDVAGEMEGSLGDLLTAERTVLNFLTHLSGIATLTRAFVDAVGQVDAAGNRTTVIRDTRKTTPGLRALEKAAVRAGGGRNHRMGLFDAVLVKDNHLAAVTGANLSESMAEVVARCRDRFPGVPVEIEADTVDQARAAAAAGADLVLLDNMTPEEVAGAVEVLGDAVPVEVSGGVTVDNVAEYAAAYPDFVAVGALTHSAPAVDIALDLVDADDEE